MKESDPRFCAICDKPLTGEPQRVLCDACAAMIDDREFQPQQERDT